MKSLENILKEEFNSKVTIDGDEIFVEYDSVTGDKIERILFLDKIKKLNKKYKNSGYYIRPKQKEI
jgi:hypothetical protein